MIVEQLMDAELNCHSKESQVIHSIAGSSTIMEAKKFMLFVDDNY